MIVPIMPVDPVAPAINRSVPPTYANIAATLRDFILHNYISKKINNLRAHIETCFLEARPATTATR